MLQALLHGKLSREQERMEDLLTSAVFGRLKYLPPEVGLFRFLEKAEATDCSMPPLANLCSEYAGATVEYEFWPAWTDNDDCSPCEPDLLLRINGHGGQRAIIAIEAKFKSGKSGLADETVEVPTDQLAKEWDNLMHVAEREGIDHAGRWLVYLTANVGVPTDEINASCKQYRSEREQGPSPKIVALSWRQIAEVFPPNGDPILSDLRRLMRRLGLLYYHGLGQLKPTTKWGWHFSRLPRRWMRLSQRQSILWRFRNAR